MKNTWALLAVAMAALSAARADDKDDQISALQAENKVLKANIEQLDNQIQTLKDEIRTLKAGPDQAEVEKLRRELAEARAEIKAMSKNELPPAQAAKEERRVVLPVRDFNSLPKGTETGKPLGFTHVAMDAVGYLPGARVIQILDESTAIVEVILADKTGTISSGTSHTDLQGRHWLEPAPLPATKQVMIEGMPTKGQADDAIWRLDSWFKIVKTREWAGRTYFVAWPIVQADRSQRPAGKGGAGK